MPKSEVIVSGHREGSLQEIRFTLDGGGPGGMEIVVQSHRNATPGIRREVEEGEVQIKIWHPFNHEWVTVPQHCLVYHGNTAK